MGEGAAGAARPTEPEGDALELAEALEALADYERRKAAGELRFLTLHAAKRRLGLVP